MQWQIPLLYRLHSGKSVLSDKSPESHLCSFCSRHSPILFICRKPYCQQISIITPRNCRLMIMQIKWGIRITCRTYHKWYRRQKHRCDSRYFFPFYRCIFYRFLIERDRGRCSRYIQTSICFHNSKSGLGMFIFREHSQSIGTSQVFLRGDDSLL